MLWSFMEANNTLWYFISHLCLKKKKGKIEKRKRNAGTNISTRALSKIRFELPPDWKICSYFGCWYLSYTRHHLFIFFSPKVPIFQGTGEWISVPFDFLRKVNQCLDEHKSVFIKAVMSAAVSSIWHPIWDKPPGEVGPSSAVWECVCVHVCIDVCWAQQGIYCLIENNLDSSEGKHCA